MLLLGLLNLSIDPPDRESRGMAEDTSFNDIESIAELVGEQWMGIIDIFPEHDEPDEEGGFAKQLVEYRCTQTQVTVRISNAAAGAMNYPFAENFTVQYEPEPRVPPPWA
jgi:hypothetical protein